MEKLKEACDVSYLLPSKKYFNWNKSTHQSPAPERALRFSRLTVIATTNDGVKYLTGPDPEWDADRQPRTERGLPIYEWNGAADISGFKPVAKNFTEWLQQIL
jgi:hypothetical protein